MRTVVLTCLILLSVSPSFGLAQPEHASNRQESLPTWLDDGVFHWTASKPLLGTAALTESGNENDSTLEKLLGDDSRPKDLASNTNREVALKDPTIVFAEGKWHLFATHRMVSGTVNMQYVQFQEWSQAATAPRHTLELHDQYHCAPQVFWYTPHECWYLVYQLADEKRKLRFAPYYSKTKTISDPQSWSKPEPMISEPPDGNSRPHWIDFWVICDDQKCHLFYTSDDGNFWRCETNRKSFPLGWSKAELVMKDTKEELFEASHTYKFKGQQRYLTLIEAIWENRRYYKAWLADRLEGPWQPLATSLQKPFASWSNIQQAAPWTTNVSHGELIRSGIDEYLEIDPLNLQFVFQGASDDEYRGNRYGGIPWRIGLLQQMK